MSEDEMAYLVKLCLFEAAKRHVWGHEDSEDALRKQNMISECCETVEQTERSCAKATLFPTGQLRNESVMRGYENSEAYQWLSIYGGFAAQFEKHTITLENHEEVTEAFHRIQVDFLRQRAADVGATQPDDN